MDKIVLRIKDNSKLRFFLELLKQFDFVEVEKSTSKRKTTSKQYDLFASAGMWKNREINTRQLREKAWKRAS
ncbi:hypothetical protein QQ020_01600 [Fulvivirgaceae bacterium BMA12]|uniref:Uncharacterized protein n=1 Tax=Agaribacillus aureus TaxID=3051825 RepID=A0ABT8KZ38_9BACT|nr:hypothetical protein [Fulvivirgaceae bacterium BMA12]